MDNKFKRTLTVLNEISPSFCAAKWYNSSLWLSNGKTSSCHHPPSHQVSLKELDEDVSALHNTSFKKERRKEMLSGTRPTECSYCWRVEDLKDESVFSDRVYKSIIYSEDDISKIPRMSSDATVIPKNLEICFDNLCNLSCSYCNAEFSSTWENKLKKHGSMGDMKTGGGFTYTHNKDFLDKLIVKADEHNPYIKAFFSWYERDLKDNLTELRVSGGEPSRSPWFWKLLDIIDNPKFSFAVNSNLIMEENKLDDLISSSKKFKKFDIYTSAECFEKNQEFVRNNFKWEQWVNNISRLAGEPSVSNLHVMMTISVLSIWTVDQFLDFICELRKKKQHRKNIFQMTVNILRFPSFQSINIIDSITKKQLAIKIEEAVQRNINIMSDLEINQFQRLILYLNEVDVSYDDTDSLENKIHDFKTFMYSYCKINKFNLNNMMPTNFLKWWDVING